MGASQVDANRRPLPTGPESRKHRDPARSPKPQGPGSREAIQQCARRSSSAPGTWRGPGTPELTVGADVSAGATADTLHPKLRKQQRWAREPEPESWNKWC